MRPCVTTYKFSESLRATGLLRTYVKKIDLHLNADLNFPLGTTKKSFSRKSWDQQNMKSL